jgi:hypothetical protein
MISTSVFHLHCFVETLSLCDASCSNHFEILNLLKKQQIKFMRWTSAKDPGCDNVLSDYVCCTLQNARWLWDFGRMLVVGRKLAPESSCPAQKHVGLPWNLALVSAIKSLRIIPWSTSSNLHINTSRPVQCRLDGLSVCSHFNNIFYGGHLAWNEMVWRLWCWWRTCTWNDAEGSLCWLVSRNYPTTHLEGLRKAGDYRLGPTVTNSQISWSVWAQDEHTCFTPVL